MLKTTLTQSLGAAGRETRSPMVLLFDCWHYMQFWSFVSSAAAAHLAFDVVRLSSVCLCNLQNQLFLKYQQWDFNETSQELSLNGPLLNLFHAELWLSWQTKGKTSKIVLSQTASPRTQIFGMQHCLAELYKVCKSHDPVVKIGPAPGVTCFTKRHYEGKNYSCKKHKPYV